MTERYTHDYTADYAAMRARGLWRFEITEAMIERFEREAAEYLRGCVSKDVGAVVLYMDSEGEQAAYFDYENFVGSIYCITGRRSYEI